MAYGYLVAPQPGLTANSRYLGAYLYTATGAEGATFTITHNLNLTPTYLVTCSPQGARVVPTIDPAPPGGTQALNTCQVATSAPLNLGDRFLFTFFTVPS